VHGRLLDRTIAYVTSDTLVPGDIADAYRVLDTCRSASRGCAPHCASAASGD